MSSCAFNSVEWVFAHLKSRVRKQLVEKPLHEIYEVNGEKWREIVRDELKRLLTMNFVCRLLRANHTDLARKLR